MTNELEVKDIDGNVLQVGDQVLYSRSGYKLTRSLPVKGIITDICKMYITIEGDYRRMRTNNSHLYIYKL